MAQNSLLIASIFNTQLAIQKLRFDVDYSTFQVGDFNILQHLKNESNAGLLKAARLDPVLTNNLFLYFDIDQDEMIVTQNIIRRVYEIIEELIVKFNKAHETNPGTEEKQEYYKTVEQFTLAYNDLVKVVRDQMQMIRDSFDDVA